MGEAHPHLLGHSHLLVETWERNKARGITFPDKVTSLSLSLSRFLGTCHSQCRRPILSQRATHIRRVSRVRSKTHDNRPAIRGRVVESKAHKTAACLGLMTSALPIVRELRRLMPALGCLTHPVMTTGGMTL